MPLNHPPTETASNPATAYATPWLLDVPEYMTVHVPWPLTRLFGSTLLIPPTVIATNEPGTFAPMATALVKPCNHLGEELMGWTVVLSTDVQMPELPSDMFPPGVRTRMCFTPPWGHPLFQHVDLMVRHEGPGCSPQSLLTFRRNPVHTGYWGESHLAKVTAVWEKEFPPTGIRSETRIRLRYSLRPRVDLDNVCFAAGITSLPAQQPAGPPSLIPTMPPDHPRALPLPSVAESSGAGAWSVRAADESDPVWIEHSAGWDSASELPSDHQPRCDWSGVTSSGMTLALADLEVLPSLSQAHGTSPVSVNQADTAATARERSPMTREQEDLQSAIAEVDSLEATYTVQEERTGESDRSPGNGEAPTGEGA